MTFFLTVSLQTCNQPVGTVETIMLLLTITLTLLAVGVNALSPKDCGGGAAIAHLTGVAVEFKDVHGKQSAWVKIPGKVQVTSGRLSFKGAVPSTKGALLRLDVKKRSLFGGWTDVCSTFLKPFCELKVCDFNAQTKEICAKMTSGRSFQVKEPISVDIPDIPKEYSALLPVINGHYRAKARIFTATGHLIGCVDVGEIVIFHQSH